MKNPYKKLHIYNFDGIPVLGRSLAAHGLFLGMWEEAGTTFLFFSAPCDDLVARVAEDNPQVRLVDTYEMTGEQWHGDRIEPYWIKDLCVAPPWEVPDRVGKYPPVLLDPGVVFGTGRHPTTETCLSLMIQVCTCHRVGCVLDIGTGTGLLALAGARLGCKPVLACDFNLLAVETTLKNIRLNQLENSVQAFDNLRELLMPIEYP
jgi:ribosomal protein L11 methyltransferase